MPKSKLLSYLTRILLLVALFNITTITPGLFAATCTGADPCNACKNCKYCKHCAKDGGTCGVCKRSKVVSTPSAAKQ